MGEFDGHHDLNVRGLGGGEDLDGHALGGGAEDAGKRRAEGKIDRAGGKRAQRCIDVGEVDELSVDAALAEEVPGLQHGSKAQAHAAGPIADPHLLAGLSGHRYDERHGGCGGEQNFAYHRIVLIGERS